MKNIAEVLEGVRTVGIAGHIRPDGDCVGSNLALYLYIKKNFPEIQPTIYLCGMQDVFSYLEGYDEIKTEADADKIYDLFITCDVSAKDRIEAAGEMWENAKKTVCIDHHISNLGFADENHICGDIGSASEVLYNLLDPEKLDRSIAEALYTGIVHDTGVFQYSSTSPDTMRIAGELMKYGFDFSRIIEESFYQKSYIQNQVMGRVLAESLLLLDGTCIVGYLKKRDMDFYGVTGKDLDGIVSQLRLTKGVKAAIFAYELDNMKFKVSLRSSSSIDVSKTAVYFGGGGHVKAAGCELEGSIYDVINNVMEQIAIQLHEQEETAEQ